MALGVINGNLISGEHYDYAGNPYPSPQTMAGVEIDVDSDEFREWYRAFITSNLGSPTPDQYDY